MRVSDEELQELIDTYTRMCDNTYYPLNVSSKALAMHSLLVELRSYRQQVAGATRKTS